MATNSIAQAIAEAFGAWKTFLVTREAAYKRKMSKKDKKAIEYGERMALRIKELKIEDKQLNKMVLQFFKYN